MMLRFCSLMILASACVVAGEVSRTGLWVRSSDAAPNDHMLHVTLALKHDTATEKLLTDVCDSVSNPFLPSYSQHLSQRDLTTLLAPALEKSLNTVTEWLQAHGLAFQVTGNGDSVLTTMSVATASELFDLEFSVFSHNDYRDARLVRSLRRPNLPKDLDDAVDVVLGLSDFPPLKPRRQQSTGSTSDAAAGPSAPIVSLVALDETSCDLYFIQLCDGDAMANTSVPCSNTANPIDKYFVQIQHLDGSTSNLTLTTPVDLEMHHSRTELGQAVVMYQLSLPTVLPAFARVLVQMKAISGTAESPLAGLQFNSTTVPSQDQYLLATPFVTPHFIRSYYGLPSHTAPSGGSSNLQAVGEFGGQFYSPSDMTEFANKYDPLIKPAEAVLVRGVNNASLPGGEAMLDIEWILAVAPQVASYFWSVEPSSTPPPSGTYFFILDWAIQVNNATNPPLVSSLSYGLPEREVALQLDPTYVKRTNTELLKLCARGLTVTVSSGDAGATGNGHSTQACELTAQFPTSSPWVTSVSATLISNAAAPRKGSCDSSSNGCWGEVSVSIPNGLFWTTGGGFSNESSQPQPSWQKDVVQSYLSSAASSGLPMPPTGSFNPSLRAYPDVSAVGHNLLTTTNGFTQPVDGTSASSPIFAGTISLLNSYRLDAGKASLGFLNPLLYSAAASNPEIFYDVVIGENHCGVFQCCPGLGYSTAAGWDAVTGLGSIQDFNALKTLVLSLP